VFFKRGVRQGAGYLVSPLPTAYEHKHTKTHLPEDERGLSSQMNKNRVNAALLVQLYSYGWTYKT